MGTYDEILGDDGRRHQVKCWGAQRPHEYRVGDPIVLIVRHPVPHSVALAEGGFANIQVMEHLYVTEDLVTGEATGHSTMTGPTLVSITDEPLFEPVIDKWGDPADLDDPDSLQVPPWWRESSAALDEAKETGDFERLAVALDELMPGAGIGDQVRELIADLDKESDA